MARVIRHGTAWTLLWAFWVFVSRDHHPTLFIDMVATALLMLASAAAFYVNLHILVPRFWARGHRAIWAASFLAVVAVLAFVTALVIAAFYDAAWGTDPARYSLGMNVAMESAWIALHTLGGAALMVGIDRMRGVSR